MKERVMQTVVHRSKKKYEVVEDMDQVYIYPDYIVGLGKLSFKEVRSFLEKKSISDNDGPFTIKEMYQEDGEIFLSLVTDMWNEIVPARYCVFGFHKNKANWFFVLVLWKFIRGKKLKFLASFCILYILSIWYKQN